LTSVYFHQKNALSKEHVITTKEHIYGISSGYLGQLPENLIEPYVKVSTKWQVLMRVPEGGKQVKLTDFPNKRAWAKYLSLDKSSYLCNHPSNPPVV